VAFSNFIPSSLLIIFAQVKTAISFNNSFLLSPNQGALIAKTFKTHFNLFRIIVVKASPSTSSAIITKSFLPDCINCSKTGNKSFILEIFQSVNKIGAFFISEIIFSGSLTIYGLKYQLSNSIHSVISTSNQKV
jgi:hypothetical protein